MKTGESIGDSKSGLLNSQSPRPLKKNRHSFPQFTVARKRLDLYDSRKALERDPGKHAMATARSILVVAILGGAIWFLLLKVLMHLWVTR